MPKFNDGVHFQLRTVAKEHRQKMTFVHLDIGNEENEGLAEFFGVTKVFEAPSPYYCCFTKCFILQDTSPTFAIFEMEGSSKYLPAPEKAKEITAENLKTFVVEYFAGKLQKFLKSQALPEDWDATAVKTLVSSNFEQVAKDKSKDVFVKFYAPWCGE